MTLAEWRKQRHLTQREMAERLGVDQPQLSKWESGEYQPTLKSAMKIVEVTKGEVTLADLVKTAERG